MNTISLKPRENQERGKNQKSDFKSCKWLHRIVFMAFVSYFISRVGMSCLKLMEEDLGTIEKKAVVYRVLYPSALVHLLSWKRKRGIRQSYLDVPKTDNRDIENG